MQNSEKGAIPILIILAAVGLIAFLAISSIAPFRDKLFSSLYPKPSSFASVSNPITPTPAGDNPPTVSITNLANGSFVERNKVTTITADAEDDHGISKVEFYVNNKLICTDNPASTYNCDWKVPAKKGVTYTLQVKAYDTAGQTGIYKISVTSK